MLVVLSLRDPSVTHSNVNGRTLALSTRRVQTIETLPIRLLTFFAFLPASNCDRVEITDVLLLLAVETLELHSSGIRIVTHDAPCTFCNGLQHIVLLPACEGSLKEKW